MIRPNLNFRPNFEGAHINLQRLSKWRLNRFTWKFLIGFSVVALLVFLTILVGKSISQPVTTSRAQNDSRIEVKGAKKTFEINHESVFPLKNDQGKEVSNINFNVERAELRDEIIIAGKKASSVKGRTFLIINLKIVNDFKQPIEIKTGNYVRLSVNGNEIEWLAPDIHNDPVEIQPISTKYTRIGFPVNDTDTNLKLQVGEIDGEKKVIELNFN